MIADNKQLGVRRGAPNCQASGEGSKDPFLKPSLINITLTKPRSPRVVRIFSDKQDPFFTHVHVAKAQTGEVVETHFILSSDAGQWQGIYERDGFTTTKR